MKQNGLFPAGSVPIYIDGAGKQYNQLNAIMIMLAKQNGLYSDDPDMAYVNDWAIDTIGDIMFQPDFIGPFFKPDLS